MNTSLKFGLKISSIAVSVVILTTPLQANAVDVVDVEFLDYDHNIAIGDYAASVGQTFIATYPELDFIDVRLWDQNGTDHQTYIQVREDNLSGSLVGQSQTVMLEDCFNFAQGPGCGFSGGDATDIQFDFSSLVLNAGSTYFFEIIDVNSTLGVGYYTGGGYGEGDAYFLACLQQTIYGSESDISLTYPNPLDLHC